MKKETVNQNLVQRMSDLEDALSESIAEIDQTSGSRNELQETLDSIRGTLATAYGEPFTNDVNEDIKKNPFWSFGEKKEYYAGFWTEDGEYHNAYLKGRNKADAKRFAKKGWGKNIEFDYIEEG
jgi:hypothetical protein